MTLREVERIIKQGEGERIEFKRKVKFPEKIIKEIVAFANSKGGSLIIGVDDDGSMPGVKHADEEHFLLARAITDLCRPKIEYTHQVIPLNAKRFLIHYQIASGKSKPYFAFYKKEHKYGKAFVRVADKSIQASREIRQILKYSMQETVQGFEYGAKEKILLNYLGTNPWITLKIYQEIANLEHKAASEILIKLTLNSVLEIVPLAGEDRYIFVE